MIMVLHEPEIPPNTGNIARLCAAFETELHLIEPLGFRLEDRYLKRAGLDYWPHVHLEVWPSWTDFQKGYLDKWRPRLILATTRGQTCLQEFSFHRNDAIVLGPETRGLPEHILAISPYHVRIPIRKMNAGGVRSLNLSTAAGIMLFTALNNCGLLGDFN